MGDTKIAWCDKTLNVVTGCSKGCEFCYAKRIHNRHLPGHHNAGMPFNQVQLHPERLLEPSKWKKPQRVFICSMGDLFDPQVPFDFIGDVITMIAGAKQHTFIVLTKQPAQMLKWFHQEWTIWGAPAKPLRNLILGVSVTNQEDADERIPILINTPAALRCVSYEPAMGLVNLRLGEPIGPCGYYCSEEHGHVDHRRLDWVICGGMSGPKAIRLDPEWVRSVRNQCQQSGVSFFFKSWGAFEQGIREWGNNSKRSGNMIDGRQWLEFPKIP